MVKKGQVLKCPECETKYCKALTDIQYGQCISHNNIEGIAEPVYFGLIPICSYCKINLFVELHNSNYWSIGEA